jgi:hypothetical protein
LYTIRVVYKPFTKNTNRLSKTNTQEEGNNNVHCNDSGSSSASGGVCGDGGYGGSISKISKKMTTKTMMTMTKRMTKTKKRKIQKTKKNWTQRMNAIYVTLYSIPSKNYSAKK